MHHMLRLSSLSRCSFIPCFSPEKKLIRSLNKKKISKRFFTRNFYCFMLFFLFFLRFLTSFARARWTKQALYLEKKNQSYVCVSSSDLKVFEKRKRFRGSSTSSSFVDLFSFSTSRCFCNIFYTHPFIKYFFYNIASFRFLESFCSFDVFLMM